MPRIHGALCEMEPKAERRKIRGGKTFSYFQTYRFCRYSIGDEGAVAAQPPFRRRRSRGKPNAVYLDKKDGIGKWVIKIDKENGKIRSVLLRLPLREQVVKKCICFIT